MSFGETLKKARITKQFTLRQLGALVGYPHSLLSEIENGTRPMPDNQELFMALIKTLEINFEMGMEQVKIDRMRRNPNKVVKNLMNDTQFATAFYRASEEMDTDELRELILKALNRNKTGGN